MRSLNRSRVAGLALLAIVVAFVAWSGVAFRVHSTFEVSVLYSEYADGYDSNDDFRERWFTSCYGSAWDRFSERVRADIQAHAKDHAYRTAKGNRYRALSRDYDANVSRRAYFRSLQPPTNP